MNKTQARTAYTRACRAYLKTTNARCAATAATYKQALAAESKAYATMVAAEKAYMRLW